MLSFTTPAWLRLAALGASDHALAVARVLQDASEAVAALDHSFPAYFSIAHRLVFRSWLASNATALVIRP